MIFFPLGGRGGAFVMTAACRAGLPSMKCSELLAVIYFFLFSTTPLLCFIQLALSLAQATLA